MVRSSIKGASCAHQTEPVSSAVSLGAVVTAVALPRLVNRNQTGARRENPSFRQFLHPASQRGSFRRYDIAFQLCCSPSYLVLFLHRVRSGRQCIEAEEATRRVILPELPTIAGFLLSFIQRFLQATIRYGVSDI